MGIVWILIVFILYILIGISVCNKIGILYGSDDTLDLIVDSVLIAFWPAAVLYDCLLGS